MFDKEFDEPIESEILQLVEQYETALKNDTQVFFEHSSFEYIIEYYEQRRNLAKASRVVNMAMGQYPFSATFLVKKAEFLTEQKCYDEATELLDKAYVLDPHDINIYLVKTDIMVWQGRHDEAITTLQDLMSSVDNYERAELYLEMADIYEDNEKYLEVIECLKETLRLSPQNEEALNRLWFSYELTELYEDSISFHENLLEEQPYAHIAWYNLAHAYNGIGEFAKAKDAFDYVLAIDETFDAAYVDCADLLIKEENYKGAIEYLNDALKVMVRPKKEVFFNIGLCYEKLENFRKARYYYRKTIAIDAMYHEAYYRIGENYAIEDEWQKALTAYQNAVELKDNEETYLTALAHSQEELGLFEKASQTFRAILEIEPSRKENWINLANSLFSESLYLDALETLDDAQIIFADDADIAYIKSAFNYTIGNKKEAIVNLEIGLIKDYDLHHMIFSLNDDMMEDRQVMDVIDQYRI